MTNIYPIDPNREYTLRTERGVFKAYGHVLIKAYLAYLKPANVADLVSKPTELSTDTPILSTEND